MSRCWPPGRPRSPEARAPAQALALANQGETVLAWERRTGQPLTPAIGWQDRRSAGVCARLASQAGRLTEITGLPLDPYFAAPKMTWLRENLTGDGVVTTTDSWLLARLGAGYLTDASTASRTLLLDLDAVRWSPAACQSFGIDLAGAAADRRLCRGQRRDHRVRAAAARGWPGRGSAGGAAGRGVPGPGRGQVHLRHGRVPAGHHRRTRRSARHTGCPRRWPGGWPARRPTAWTGRSTRPGAAIRWLTELGLLAGAADLDAAGGSVPDSGGVTFLPALAGLGAPHWRPDARGAFLGLSLGTHAGPPGPGGGGGDRRLGRAAGPRGGRGPRRAAHPAPGGRRADPVPAAGPGPGRPAAGAGAGVRGQRRDRARCRGPGPARHRRGQHAG